jgi:translation elongation factor EF-1beta|nr:hypothetical protein [bacterium]
MKTTAQYRNILPTQEEINLYEREDELARKAKLAKVENRNYKNKIKELRFNERADLSETKFATSARLLEILTMPESTDKSIKEMKARIQNDLF